VADAIQGGYAVAVSDGSFCLGHGSVAWVIEGVKKTGRILGCTRVPGEEKSQSSYRSELTGLYCTILIVPNLCCEYYKITKGEIKMGCDGESALHAAFSPYLAVVTDPAFNIKLANFHLLSNSSISNYSIKWKPAHIKGHQDDIQPKEDLSRIAQLNVEMDLLARKHL